MFINVRGMIIAYALQNRRTFSVSRTYRKEIWKYSKAFHITIPCC